MPSEDPPRSSPRKKFKFPSPHERKRGPGLARTRDGAEEEAVWAAGLIRAKALAGADKAAARSRRSAGDGGARATTVARVVIGMLAAGKG